MKNIFSSMIQSLLKKQLIHQFFKYGLLIITSNLISGASYSAIKYKTYINDYMRLESFNYVDTKDFAINGYFFGRVTNPKKSYARCFSCGGTITVTPDITCQDLHNHHKKTCSFINNDEVLSPETYSLEKQEPLEAAAIKKPQSNTEPLIPSKDDELAGFTYFPKWLQQNSETQTTSNEASAREPSDKCQYSSGTSNYDNPIENYTISLEKARIVHDKLIADLLMNSEEERSILINLYEDYVMGKAIISEFEIDTNYFTTSNSEKPAITSCKHFRNGGVKAVFECNFQGRSFALAIPASIWELDKWTTAFNEIELTNKLRQLNHPVLAYHNIIPIRMNGLTIPSIIMPLFSEIDGIIIDNRRSRIYLDTLFLKRESSGELIRLRDIVCNSIFIDVVQSLLKQCARLICDKYLIVNDALNFRVSEHNCLELFLFDLYGMDKSNHNTEWLIENYATKLMSTLYVCIETNYYRLKNKEENDKKKIDLNPRTNKILKEMIMKELEAFVLSIETKQS